MKIFIVIMLFFICAVFIYFAPFIQNDSTPVKTAKLEIYLTGYNPDFQTKGIMKSSFKHEVR